MTQSTYMERDPILSVETFDDDMSNSEQYETWKPKIAAYLTDLEKNTLPEYKVADSEIPKDLDTKVFNTIEYLSKSTALSPREHEITELSATSLSAKIAEGTYTSVDVLKAFAHRGIILQQFTNFAMQFFIDEGLKRAAELDEYLAKTGKTIGPLHGLPVSLKEQIGYAGKISCGGWVGLLNNIPTEDATTIKMLRKLGAVFYVRTNEPQSLMQMDSNNNIIGRSRNAHNSLCTPGGSSGGEGACISGRASVIGMGTDIGGSIRAPAAFSGTYGLRPTSRRISVQGGVSAGKGQESVVSVCGPLTNCIDDIELFMKSYINEGHPWDDDPWCIPVLWRDVAKPNPKDITVAILYDDGQMKPHPPIIRGLEYVEAKLKAAGVNVVKFEPIETVEAFDVIHEMWFCDGNQAQKDLIKLSGEPILPLTKWAFGFNPDSKMYSAQENRDLNYRRDVLRKKYTDYFVKQGVDFIISPPHHSCSPVCINEGVLGPYYMGYTTIYNILDFPALIFPTGLMQDPSVDLKDETFEPRSNMEKFEYEKYDPESYKGAPITLQLASRRYFDEEVVAFGKVIEDILK